MGFPELGRHIPPSYAAARAALPEALARELCMTGRLLDAPRPSAAASSRRSARARTRWRSRAAIAEAPPAATREVKRRALLAARARWLPLLADELEQLRLALLG